MAITPTALRLSISQFISILFNLNHGIYTAWDTRTFNFSSYDNMQGELRVDNAKVSLTVNKFNLFSVFNVTEESDGNLRACVGDMTFPEFNVTFDYVADFEIDDEIAFYGSGSYKAGMNDVRTSFCWLLLASTADEILDFDIKVQFRHRPTYLTGIYLNEELDFVVAKYLTLAKRLFAMWNDYEPECASRCILNPAFLFMTNYLIHDKIHEVSFDGCGCLKQFVEQLGTRTVLGDDYDMNDLYGDVNYFLDELIDGSLKRRIGDLLFNL